MGEKPFIAKFLHQRCEGYSEDFTTTYYSGRALMSDGSEENVYLVDKVDRISNNWKVGDCPIPPVPVRRPQEVSDD